MTKEERTNLRHMLLTGVRFCDDPVLREMLNKIRVIYTLLPPASIRERIVWALRCCQDGAVYFTGRERELLEELLAMEAL